MARIRVSPLKALGLPILVLAWLPGCAGSDEAKQMQASARLEGGQIQVRVEDVPPGRALLAIVLVDPGGKQTPARQRRLETEQIREEPAAEGESEGILSYVTLDFLFDGSEEVRNVEYLAAVIKPKDLLRYVVEYQDSRIEVRYSNARGEKGKLTIPAPGPHDKP